MADPFGGFPMFSTRLRELTKNKMVIAIVAIFVAALAARALFFAQDKPPENAAKPRKLDAVGEQTVELSEKQAATLKIEKVRLQTFEQEKQAVGSVDFNQNLLVQVFTPYQGRIIAAIPNVGDRVEKGEILFTIDSPDLLTAEATLITAAGVRILQGRTLGRVKSLQKIGGASQQSVDQTTSDEQAAEGAWRSARDAVRIFGKTEEEIDKIVAERKADSRLVVRSPISGYVTARTAAPGLYVQPGVAPPPFAVADTSMMWMVANVVESDAPSLRVGQLVKARVAAYPGRVFEGKVTVVGPSVDPITRRVFVRSELSDTDHSLRAGMFANFSISVGAPMQSPAAPQSAVVREGDGSMSAWTTTDQRRFTRRAVNVGQRRDGSVQILEGLNAGDTIVGEGALFLSQKAAIDATE
jgi:cobalt-zinc-cadmium efflux system membrane fusion protein